MRNLSTRLGRIERALNATDTAGQISLLFLLTRDSAAGRACGLHHLGASMAALVYDGPEVPAMPVRLSPHPKVVMGIDPGTL